MLQRIDTGYRPRPEQAAIHCQLKRFNVIVAHRRFGKTVLCVNALIDAALRCGKPDPRFAYIAPLFNQAKDIAWSYLKQYALGIPGAEANESELRIDLPNGARIRLYGADNPDRLRGIYLDGVVLDEYADMDPRVWTEVLRPALADRKGWAIFIGTPKGQNAFYEIYESARSDPNWYAGMFRASETGLVDAGELAAAAKVMSKSQMAQEFECSFEAAITGAYYGEEMQAAVPRIRGVPYQPGVAVLTGWDLGVSDSTVIWFAQQVGKEVHLIDYIEHSGVALEWYVKELQSRPYIYGDHFLPHDANARELGSGKTRVETLNSLGVRNIQVLPAQSIADGINAVRLTLPLCWFDAEKCAKGVKALQNYRRAWDDKRQVFHDRPLHDWASHPADAMRTLAMGLPHATTAGWGKKLDYSQLDRMVV